jgi:hypothetical protein
MTPDDLKFWIPTGLTALLAIIMTLVTYYREGKQKLRWWVILIPVAGAIFGIIFAYSANKDAFRALRTAHENDSIYKSKFDSSLNASRLIIDSLDSASKKVEITLHKTDSVLDVERTEADLTSRQLKQTNIILLNSKENLNKAGLLIGQFQRLNDPLQNLYISFNVNYPFSGYRGNPYFFSNHKIFLDSLNALIYKDSFVRTTLYNLTDGTNTLKKYYVNGLAYIVKDFNSKNDSSLHSLRVNEFNSPNRENSNRFFPYIGGIRMLIYDRAIFNVDGSIDDSKSKVNTIYTTRSWNIDNKVNRYAQIIVLGKQQVTEVIEAPLSKELDLNNQIRSPQDLKGRIVKLELALIGDVICQSIQLNYGENNSKSIRIEKKQILNNKNGVFVVQF